jgi:hypothetical protein
MQTWVAPLNSFAGNRGNRKAGQPELPVTPDPFTQKHRNGTPLVGLLADPQGCQAVFTHSSKELYMPITGQDLIVNRANLRETQTVQSKFPETPEDGHCLLRIDRFALTANNITYAVAPDAMGYWNFFPSDQDGFGRVPVWGYAEVIASAHPQIATGTRVYGYLPMSTHLMIQPGKITPFGMTDIIPHRQEMSPIYNQYSFTSQDPAYAPEHEGLISLLRPLFTTSFLLDDLHRENDCFGADTLILSSASSKTAIGVAFLMARHKPAGLKIIGLTSAGNIAFTESLGCYDQVITYDAIETLPKTKTAFIDMAGDADTLRRVHGHLDEQLTNSCRVGLTHWQNASNYIEGLKGGPKPEFFFAPTYAQQRIKDWTPSGFLERVGTASTAFFTQAAKWMSISHTNGPDAVQSSYTEMLNGRINPAQGHILSMHR